MAQKYPLWKTLQKRKETPKREGTEEEGLIIKKRKMEESKKKRWEEGQWPIVGGFTMVHILQRTVKWSPRTTSAKEEMASRTSVVGDLEVASMTKPTTIIETLEDGYSTEENSKVEAPLAEEEASHRNKKYIKTTTRSKVTAALLEQTKAMASRILGIAMLIKVITNKAITKIVDTVFTILNQHPIMSLLLASHCLWPNSLQPIIHSNRCQLFETHVLESTTIHRVSKKQPLGIMYPYRRVWWLKNSWAWDQHHIYGSIQSWTCCLWLCTTFQHKNSIVSTS